MTWTFSPLPRPARIALWVALIAMAASTGRADILINEVLASNATISPDNVDFDDSSDWIELHNTSNMPVLLDGYFLTDDLTQPLQWAIPSDSTIPAKGYFVARADGFDAGPGEKHTRAFAPWDDFTTKGFHTNFKLSGTGETLALHRAEGGLNSLELVSLGADWRYLDDGSDPGSDWATPEFDDAQWPMGPAPRPHSQSWKLCM